MKTVHPDIEWQATMLATKVLKRAMTLQAAVSELDDWQCQTGIGEKHRAVDSRTLIITHALNSLIKRAY